VGIQTEPEMFSNDRNYRSVGIQAVKKVGTAACSPFTKLVDSSQQVKPAATEMGKVRTRLNFTSEDAATSSSEQENESSSESEYSSSEFESEEWVTDSDVDSASGSSDGESSTDPRDQSFSEQSLIRTRKVMSMFPKIFFGIISTTLALAIIQLLSYKIPYPGGKLTSQDVVCLILRKVRLNESFAMLGIEFGISEYRASEIFRTYVSFIGDHLKELVFWPDSDKIKQNLPIAFRKNYSKVESIIDCLEIEIEKPSNPIHQALTWSSYKSANTLKYLISITPDGLVNFISKGFGGRTTDEAITEKSGFYDKLKAGIHVMADRGFKRIERMILKAKCFLVRPASVSRGVKLAKKSVIESRKISGCRIHVERGIRRIREFKFLSPHSCIDSKLIKYSDDCMNIACGLVNLQSPLIK